MFHLKYIFDGKTTYNFVPCGAMWCRGVPWGVIVGSYGFKIYIHFGAVGCQQLLILVPWGVQIVNVNLTKTHLMVKLLKPWCRGVPWGVVGCRGVISNTI